MRVARVWRTSVLAVGVLLAGQVAPLTAAHADPPPPFASVTSPTGGVVTGTVAVAVLGHTDGTADAADTITSIALLVDGTPVGTAVDCSASADPYNCTGSVSWDAGAETPGPHTLVAAMSAVDSGVIDSTPAVTVTVPSPPPPPTVAITSTSASGGNVRGVVHVSATGTIDAASSDTPVSLQLKVNGAFQGAAVTCTANPCSTTALSYDTTPDGDNVAEHLRVVFVTADDSVTSGQVTVTSDNPTPPVTITDPPNGSNQAGLVQVTASGSIPSGETDAANNLQLFANGAFVASASCSSSPTSCTRTLTWDATGKAAGSYVLRVYFFTDDHPGGAGAQPDSDTVSVHVTSPLPTAAITSPAAGATVSGVVPVSADGEVDASQTDTAGTMQLFADGAAVGGPVDCPGSSKSCPVNFSWDASALLGTHHLHVKFITANGVQVTTNDESVNVVIVPPTATVTAPAPGASVSGVVPVAATGVTDSRQSDTPLTLQLLIDGVAVGAPTACPATHSCTLPYSWDTTGLSGAHTVQSRLVTVKGVTALSAVTTVTAVSPAPIAVITSPTAGSTVSRSVTVTVSGTVDATQTDAPATMTLTVDGTALGAAQPCPSAPGAPRSCQTTFTWNSLGLTGRHVLVATLTTLDGVTGTSAATTVYIYGGTSVTLPKVHTLRAGRSVTITGHATYLINKAGVAAVPVKILLVFSNGKTRAFTVTTDAKGFYKVTFVPTMNTVVEATVVALAYNGTSHTFTRLAVIPQPSCTLKAKIARGVQAKGVCKLLGMPKGTKLKLQYEVKGKWYTLGTGRAPGTKVPFVYGFKVAGVYHVRLVFAASHVFVATTGPSLKVVVT